jgi:hypothetical protein
MIPLPGASQGDFRLGFLDTCRVCEGVGVAREGGGGYVTGLAMHFCTSALNFVTSVMPVLTTCSVQYWYDIVWPPTSPPPMARTAGRFLRQSRR